MVMRATETPEINCLETCPDNCDNIENVVVYAHCKNIKSFFKSPGENK